MRSTDIEDWFMDPIGAMRLPDDEREFVEKWDIKVSTGYIGLIRAYWYDEEAGYQNVVFQTSVADSLSSALESSDYKKSYQERVDADARHRECLREQFGAWVRTLQTGDDDLVLAVLKATRHGLLEEFSGAEGLEEFMRGLS
jgi:hypothetical protein